MNLGEFLDMVRPGLEPDIPYERKTAILCGETPDGYDEEIWAEWHQEARP